MTSSAAQKCADKFNDVYDSWARALAVVSACDNMNKFKFGTKSEKLNNQPSLSMVNIVGKSSPNTPFLCIIHIFYRCYNTFYNFRIQFIFLFYFINFYFFFTFVLRQRFIQLSKALYNITCSRHMFSILNEMYKFTILSTSTLMEKLKNECEKWWHTNNWIKCANRWNKQQRKKKLIIDVVGVLSGM